MALPPPVRRSDCVAVSTDDRRAVRPDFAPFIRQLHAFLNGLPCLQDVQDVRSRWTTKLESHEAFGEFVVGPGYWFTRHIGSGKEAQLNIALSSLAFLRQGDPPTPCPPPYFRVGLGFAMASGQSANHTAAARAYMCLLRMVRNGHQSAALERLVQEARLEGEWYPREGGPIQFVPPEGVAVWLRGVPDATWLFIGRMLRCGVDGDLLEDPVRLAQVIDTTFAGLRPLWEQAMCMAMSPDRYTQTKPSEAEPSPGTCPPPLATDPPLTPDVLIAAAPPDLPSDAAAFLGCWEGTWDDGLRSRLIVQRIDPALARVVYSWGSHPAQSVRAGWGRYGARVLPGAVLQFESPEIRYTFSMTEEQMHIRGKREALRNRRISRISMRRVVS